MLTSLHVACALCSEYGNGGWDQALKHGEGKGDFVSGAGNYSISETCFERLIEVVEIWTLETKTMKTMELTEQCEFFLRPGITR